MTPLPQTWHQLLPLWLWVKMVLRFALSGNWEMLLTPSLSAADKITQPSWLVALDAGRRLFYEWVF